MIDLERSEALEDFSPRRGTKINAVLLSLLQAIIDMVAILAANIVSISIYHRLVSRPFYLSDNLIGVGEMAALVFVVVAYSRGLYATEPAWHDIRRKIVGAVITWLIAFATISAILFVLKVGAEFSRGTTAVFFLCGLLFLIVERMLIAHLYSWAFETGRIARKRVALLVIGPDDISASLARDVADQGRSLAQIWHSKPLRTRRAAEELGLSMISALQTTGFTEIMIAAPTSQLGYARRVSEQLRLAPLQVRLLLDPGLDWLASSSSTLIGDRIAIELSREPLGLVERGAKRAMDIVIASLALFTLAPLLIVVAIAIRLETPGPVLFRQRRDGFNNQPFLIYKFRSMRVTEDGPVVRQARRGDDRVTRIGRFIRRTSIDELPQLWNVLRGEMSIIGPRPHAVAHGQLYSRMIGEYAHRHHVKPGLTGWAQVNGSRGETPTVESMKRRVDYDIWYIDHWSFWLDVRILLLTARQVVMGRDAF